MIHLFYCSNSMSESEARQLVARFGASELKMLGLPCAGKITIPYLVKAFESGADGVVLCSCVPAECRNLEGNLRASKRAHAVDNLMEEVGLGKDRILSITKSKAGVDEVADQIERFRSGLAPVPTPNRISVIQKESTPGARTRRENAA